MNSKKKRRKIKFKIVNKESESMRLERLALAKCMSTQVKRDKKKYTRKEKYRV
jgi:hypothetical protein